MITTWNTSTPTAPGIYTASSCEPRNADYLRFWDGVHWSSPIHHEDVADPVRLERARTTRGETQDDIVWSTAH